MATLADLVSEPVDVTGPVHADLNHVLVVLRNGRPIRLVGPGKRLGKLGLGLLGHLQALQISLSPVKVNLTLTDVPLRIEDGTQFHLPEVRLSIRMRVTDDLDALESALSTLGLRFAEALQDEAQDEVVTRVRHVFTQLHHAEIWEASSLRSRLGAVRRVLGGAVVIDYLSEPLVTPDPRYRDMIDARADAEAQLVRQAEQQRVRTQTVTHDEEVQLLQVRAESSIFGAKVEALAGVARAHNLNLQHLLYPELQSLEREQRHEVIMALLADPNILRRNAGLEAALMGHLAQLSVPTVLEQPAPRLQGRVITHQPSVVSGGERLMTPPLQISDPQLEAVWNRVRAPRGLMGLGFATAGGRAQVLAVVEDGERVTAPFPAASEVCAADVVELVQVPYEQALEDLVSAYMQQQLRDLPAGAIRFEPIAEGSRLRLNLSSQQLRPITVKRALEAPGNLVLPTLQSVLPYSGIDPVLQNG